MRILVCGSRTWTNFSLMYNIMFGVDSGPHILIHGATDGADVMAARIATSLTHWTTQFAYAAQWDIYGSRAGPIRNAQMLREGKPELVLAFWDGQSPGTKNMISLAKKAGIEVREYVQ